MLRRTSSLGGNSTKFAHVLLSILNNARDIIHERHIRPAVISINSYNDSGYYFLEIRDNAGGVTTEPAERIFELGVSDKQSEQSGVGLYIARKIIEERFHGEIGVANDEKGAVFSLVIPLPTP